VTLVHWVSAIVAMNTELGTSLGSPSLSMVFGHALTSLFGTGYQLVGGLGPNLKFRAGLYWRPPLYMTAAVAGSGAEGDVATSYVAHSPLCAAF